MLLTLTIRDIVLIQSLTLEFQGGLGILTGETGAGKSILLDALNLALGRRGDAGLVRAGAKQGSVTAIFAPGKSHPVFSLFEDNFFKTFIVTNPFKHGFKEFLTRAFHFTFHEILKNGSRFQNLVRNSGPSKKIWN